VKLSGLAVVLGGLAVGIGFGLRDFSNSFISGIILLIERPIRAGDYVTIGEYGGQVIQIGIRSTTVLTWDNMEVVVPNSEIFSKAFVNWTRQDSVVRTVIDIRLDRNDDPYKVQTIIENVLKDNDDVVDDPTSQVFFNDIGDSLLAFEVRYFINIETSISRPRVRSDVIFAIWDALKANGIKAPYPQQSVHLIEQK